MDPAQRERELQRVAAQLEEDLERYRTHSSSSAGPCTECHYFYRDGSMGKSGYDDWLHCRNPLVAKPEFNGVDEKPDYPEVQASYARNSYGLCGPEGRLFRQRVEEPPAPISWLSRLFGG